MGSLAGMFHERGHTVTGSDQEAYPPMSDFLSSLGIPVAQGYSPANLHPQPDLVVVGNVIRRTNPEAIELERLGIPYTSLPGALARYFVCDKLRIVVTGTHGKTTVSAMIAWILCKEGLDPGFMIGGLLKNFRTNYRLGRGEFFVIEGDEYDTAYFDKRPKFLHYAPHIGVITSCEYDHADIYQSLDQIKGQFGNFAAMIPQDGALIAFAGDSAVREIISHPNGRVRTYGLGPDMNWSVVGVRLGHRGTGVQVLHRGREVVSGTLPVFGVHNILNALAALAACEIAGVPPNKAMDALCSFQGVHRRQEILGEIAGVLVMDDFAHHPSAVRETCGAVRSQFPGRRLVAVFEPRTNTSRRAVFQDAYVSAFPNADLIVLRDPRDPDKFPDGDRFSSHRLSTDLRSRGKEAHAFSDTEAILDFLLQQVEEGDVVLIMSNGSFDNLGVRLLDRLREQER
jgi:UDP-N-acetylmuramate: L-alanyl-gamma-D-glutamyl-meso-diaminopimelate ligase